MFRLNRSLGFFSFGLCSLACFSPACSSDTPETKAPATGGAFQITGGTASSTGGSAPSTGGTAGGTTGGVPTVTGGTSGGGVAAPTGGTTTGGATVGTGGSSAGSSTGGTSAGGAGAGAPAAGASGMPAGGSAGGSGGSTATGFLVEDFESQTAGKQPTGWDNFVAWNKNGMNPQGDTLALVDETRARSGTRSMHFHGGQNPAMITRPLPAMTNKLYVRAYFYMTRQLGMNPGANHETLIGIRAETGGANNEVRFGEIKGVIGTNEVPSDNIAPKMDQWGMGPVIPANQWACIEVAFIGDKQPNELHAWHGGTLVHQVTAGDQWQNGTMPDTWLNGKFVEVILGWHSFSSATNDVWMDDLVLSNSPIGCD